MFHFCYRSIVIYRSVNIIAIVRCIDTAFIFRYTFVSLFLFSVYSCKTPKVAAPCLYYSFFMLASFLWVYMPFYSVFLQNRCEWCGCFSMCLGLRKIRLKSKWNTSCRIVPPYPKGQEMLLEISFVNTFLLKKQIPFQALVETFRWQQIPNGNTWLKLVELGDCIFFAQGPYKWREKAYM